MQSGIIKKRLEGKEVMENNEIREIFHRFLKEQPVSAVLSGQVEKTDLLKVKVRPVLAGNNVRI